MKSGPEPETNQMIKKLKEEKEELNEKLQQRSQKLDLQKMMNEMKEKAISLNLKDLKTNSPKGFGQKSPIMVYDSE